jgi:hypothetical protein
MPATVHYKGSFSFLSYAELEKVTHLIKEEIQQADLSIDQAKLKLTIAVSEPFSQKEQLETIWHTAVTYAASGMLLVYHDENFEDVICSDRFDEFNPERPAMLLFTLREYESTFEPQMSISDVVFNSPFYIYDHSLKKTGPKFPDEIPISDEDCKNGFDVLKIIWNKHVSQSSTSLFHTLFKQADEGKEDTYTLTGTYGFAPGYTMETAKAQAEKRGFLVFSWDEFWER